jgi:hypothetical protein
MLNSTAALTVLVVIGLFVVNALQPTARNVGKLPPRNVLTPKRKMAIKSTAFLSQNLLVLGIN